VSASPDVSAKRHVGAVGSTGAAIVDALVNGKLGRQGAFAIGMQKGPLTDVSIH